MELAISRTLAAAPPHEREVLQLILQRMSQLWTRVDRLERQVAHLPRLAQTLGHMLATLPVYRCANGHELLGPVAPVGADAPCVECGGLAVPVMRAGADAQDTPQEQREPQTAQDNQGGKDDGAAG